MTLFAIVGCGRIAERHLAQINRTGKLVAVCNVDYEKAVAFAKPSGAAVYTSLDVLLESEPSVEVVVVCTPNGLHAEHAIKSLQSRRHVLCEKPLCIETSTALTMRDTAHFFRRNLFVVKQNRFNEPVQAVKKMIAENTLGKILSFSVSGLWSRPQEYYKGDWRGTKHLDGGILYTQFSHFIDLLLWLLGDVETIRATAQNNNLRRHFELEDTYVAVMKLKSGAVGTVHFSINTLAENKEGSFTIIGEKGSVRIGGPYLNTLEWLTPATKNYNNTIEVNQDLSSAPARNLDLVYDELQKALANLPNQLPQINEAVRTIELIEKMYAAARS